MDNREKYDNEDEDPVVPTGTKHNPLAPEAGRETFKNLLSFYQNARTAEIRSDEDDDIRTYDGLSGIGQAEIKLKKGGDFLRQVAYDTLLYIRQFGVQPQNEFEQQLVEFFTRVSEKKVLPRYQGLYHFLELQFQEDQQVPLARTDIDDLGVVIITLDELEELKAVNPFDEQGGFCILDAEGKEDMIPYTEIEAAGGWVIFPEKLGHRPKPAGKVP